jgi:hypothetical protein
MCEQQGALMSPSISSCLSHIGTEFTVWYRYPPPPFRVQNLENKRSNLRLCTRSLSLEELHAKSREHESYDGRTTRFASHFGTKGRSIAWVRLSKIKNYLIDNVCCNRLSYKRHAVNDKGFCGTKGSVNSPRSRKPRDLGHPASCWSKSAWRFVVEALVSHPCKERKDGAPLSSTRERRAIPQNGPPSIRHERS